MNINSANSIVDELFIEQLHDIYSGEQELATVLSKLEAAATTPNLKKMFGTHLTQTKQHLQRMEYVFAAMNSDRAPLLNVQTS